MYPSTSQRRRLAAKLLMMFVASVFLFGGLYFTLNQWPEHSLKMLEGKPNFLDCLYFSIVTISTLGYGDILPQGFSRLIASIEAMFGLAFVGYSISQVLSVKQEAMVAYIANDRIFQTYDYCLANVTDAKELIADRRRSIQRKVAIDPMDFIYNRGNPFYPALKAMEVLNGYTAHVAEIGRADALSVKVERAAHHVEELASFTRKYANLLVSTKADWRTDRTRQILFQLCEAIDAFCCSHVIHTRYANGQYKGGGQYREIVKRLTSDIRSKL